MSLSFDIHHRLGDFQLDARFSSGNGFTALFGASGSGKTSLVRLIAGLVRPQQGRIALGDEILVDTSAGVFVPPHRRGIGYVFQEPRLLPHLSVRQNLFYGRWFARRRTTAVNAQRVIDLLGIGALLERAPGALSGGEAQRIAIGRALLSQPRLLLMDEPLASIDELRKAEILPYLERLRDEFGIPIVYVSHALDEIVRLANTLVVIDRGRVAAAGPLAEVLARVDLPIIARRADAGVVLDAQVIAHDPQWQLSTLQCQAGTLQVPQIDLAISAPVRIWVRARDVSLASIKPEGTSIQNVFTAQVAELAHGEGATMDVRLDCSGAPLLARITRLSAQQLQLERGSAVYAMIKGVAFERT